MADKIRVLLTEEEVDKRINEVAEQINKDYAGTLGHALGHGVGLDIHEQPTLSPKNKTILKPGNIVTVEPGIYIPDFCGVRIEDMVRQLTSTNYYLVTQKYPENKYYDFLGKNVYVYN